MTEKFNWCGYEWLKSAQNGRMIHPDEPNYWYDPGCITEIGDGVLALDVRENPRDITHWDGKTYHPFYGVGLMTSVDGFSYGTFECDCKMPIGEELCSAFWLSGHESWPPEIDICENMSNKCGGYLKYLLWWNVNSNLHYRMTPEGMKEHIGGKKASVFTMRNPARNWVRYSCKWEPRKVSFYIDGKLVRTYESDSILSTYDDKTMHVAIDNWPWHANQYGTRICLPLKQPFLVKDFKYTEL